MHLDGNDLTGVALLDRKALLAKLLADAGRGQSGVIRFAGHVQGNAGSFYQNACDIGLEGIICKRADSRYRATRNRVGSSSMAQSAVTPWVTRCLLPTP